MAVRDVNRAANALLRGGIIAYPTEGVFGLGCMPDDTSAIERLLKLKRRDVRKGLILIASGREQLQDWVADQDLAALPEPNAKRPVTWIAEAGEKCGPLLCGRHPGVAVRLTTHPVAGALCNAVESPLTSTSANLSDRPVVRNRFLLRRHFGNRVDVIVAGDCGGLRRPSEIRMLGSGEVLRAQ